MFSLPKSQFYSNLDALLDDFDGDTDVWEHFDRAVEDSCDALGSFINGKMCGTFGAVSCFSFYPAHHIFSGEGGMTLTNHPQYSETIRQFVSWGRACACKPGRPARTRRSSKPSPSATGRAASSCLCRRTQT